MKTAVVFLAFSVPFLYAKLQTITVKGVVTCNKLRVANAKVELWERDPLNPDDLLQSTKTSLTGHFEVKGEQDEIGKIDPYIVITHACDVKKPGCKRISQYEVPPSKIGSVYDMTTVSLDILTAKDKEKC
ncbi:hypothetical protein Q1695_007817 [Nippostrongylus brasiliensis]|nr:hypothetical protein Q1695_007817 [Nippostrongylus brasiliensis]